jgi:hypothetical protein
LTLFSGLRKVIDITLRFKQQHDCDFGCNAYFAAIEQVLKEIKINTLLTLIHSVVSLKTSS